MNACQTRKIEIGECRSRCVKYESGIDRKGSFTFHPKSLDGNVAETREADGLLKLSASHC